MQIEKAVRKQKKARINLTGPSGSGKTFSALSLATGLAGEGGKILLIDSEQRSSELYADDFEFDIINLDSLDTVSYSTAILHGAKAGYDVIVVDSLSQAWENVLEKVENHTKRTSANSFKAWGEEGTPAFKALMASILKCPTHIITTMRVKTDYVMEEYTNSRGGTSTKPKKVGLASVFRAGNEYEFDVVANINLNHELLIEKTRIKFLKDMVIKEPGAELGEQIRAWLAGGAAVEEGASSMNQETIYPDENPEAYRIEGVGVMVNGELKHLPVAGKLMVSADLKELGMAVKPKWADYTTARDKVNITAYLAKLEAETAKRPKE